MMHLSRRGGAGGALSKGDADERQTNECVDCPAGDDTGCQSRSKTPFPTGDVSALPPITFGAKVCPPGGGKE
jgi:hypothetical protein